MRNSENILKGKPLKEGVRDFCVKYDIPYPSNISELIGHLFEKQMEAKQQKIDFVKAQNFEKAALCRDKEKTWIDLIDFFKGLNVDEDFDFYNS